MKGDISDNCYHVVIAAGSMEHASLNGFTITGGNADGSAGIVINGVSFTDNGANHSDILTMAAA